MPNTTKVLTIKDSAGTPTSRNIGAEAENIEVSRDSSGAITTKSSAASTQALNTTLKNLEDNKANISALGSKADKNTIAPLEDSTGSVSKTYSAGEYFYLDGVYKKASATINSGTSWGSVPAASYTNATGSSDNVSSQIQALTNNDDAMLNVLGAKNLLSSNAVSQTVNGVTYIVNSDGSVTANGTATKPSGATTSGLSFFIISLTNPQTLKKGTYKLTGWVGEIPGNVNLSVVNRATYTNICIVSSGFPEQTFTLSSDTSVYCELWIQWGTTINKTFYPMIRPASIEDDTYVPYAMSNKELTNRTLCFYNQSVSAATNSAIVTINDGRITTDHVVTSCEFSNPAAITSDISWNTDTAGRLILTGTCTNAQTVNIELTKKDN